MLVRNVTKIKLKHSYKEKMNEQGSNINFVKEVEKYEFLYNYTLSDYSRKDVTEKAWSEIGKQFNMASYECKEKWRNLRSVFIRHLKPLPSGSGTKKAYYLCDAMQFILPYIKMKKGGTKSNLPVTEVYEDSTDNTFTESKQQTEISPSEFLSIRSTNSRKCKKRKPEADYVDQTFVDYLEAKKSKYEKTTTPKEESTKFFLLSLQSELNNMSSTQLRLFKIEVLQLINKITLTEDNDATNQFTDYGYIEECYGTEP